MTKNTLWIIEFEQKLHLYKNLNHFSKEDIIYYWDKFELYRYVNYTWVYLNIKNIK